MSHPSTYESTANAHGISRREDLKLVQGLGRFVGDMALPGMLVAAFVRSPYSHAKVLAVQTQDACAAHGVAAVLTAQDLADLPAPLVNPLLADMSIPAGPLLSTTHVRAVGEPVALVLADTPAQAEAAVALVQVDYEELDPLLPFDVEASATASVAECRFEDGGLPATPPTATASVVMPRVSPAPLEPRACLACWDAGAHRLTVWLSTQTPSRARHDFARALALPLDGVHVVAPDVGGAFGGKASVSPEELMVAAAAMRLARPVRWQASRGEDLQYATQGRGSQAQGAIWLDDAESRIDALQADFAFSLGHWLPYSAVAPMRNAQRIVPGPYRVAHLASRATAHRSHTAAVNIYRGAGRPEAAVLLERLVDAAAAAAGIDPLALRMRSVWQAQELPRDLPNGERLDTCDLPGLLNTASEAFGYARRRAEQLARRRNGELVGIGIGLYVEPCGQGWESARLTCTAPGRFVIATGASAQGQGRETAYAAIAAQVLGCPPGSIEVLHGDTSTCPEGIGALASRSTAIGGSAVLQAAGQLMRELAEGAALPHTVELRHTSAHEAWASGCVMCQVRVDADTGVLAIEDLVWIDDAGHVVDPTMVHGQMWGGLAQGVGQALLEQVVYDGRGQLLTGSFMDYAMPRADDMPRAVHMASRPTPSAANPLGAKGVGEAGCIGVPAALLNAAYDALSHIPDLTLTFPLTPDRLWRAMRAADH
ncbi:carbon-monoxide dehydrogenase large subunit [Pseudacidovorax sp. 1753]|uniref:xanthine dehydrogenase family protein molybdopterin-binding subunit n=1 Tax=Pseudacidovorax sp. 1753 TaxID=3156419 RepID=UPI00339808A3